MKSMHRFLVPALVLAALALGAVGVAFAREITESVFIKLTTEEREFSGVVQAIDGNTWTIDGLKVVVDDRTEIKDAIAVGQVVTVHVRVGADGSMTASEIDLVSMDSLENANDNEADDIFDDDNANENEADDIFDDDNANENEDDVFDDDNANDNEDDDVFDDDNANDNEDDDVFDDDNAKDNEDEDDDVFDDGDNSNANDNITNDDSHEGDHDDEHNDDHGGDDHDDDSHDDDSGEESALFMRLTLVQIVNL